MVPDSLANVTRAAHDVGLAAWLGGAMYGKFALNPAVQVIPEKPVRGQVANAAWNGYNAVNTVGLGTAAVGWAAARFTETRPDNLSGRERTLSAVKDALMVTSVITGVANGIQGGRLAKQAPEGAVPIESGTVPAPETPPEAARIQRSLGVLGNLNIAAGVALVAANAVLAQTDHSRPPLRRALARRNSPSAGDKDGIRRALDVAGIALGLLGAADEVRRQTA
jgi:hypothetical protein